MATNDSKTTQDVREDMDALRADVDQLMGDIRALAGDQASDVPRKTKKAAKKAARKAQDAETSVETLIAENPMTACAAALGAGFLGAQLLRR